MENRINGLIIILGSPNDQDGNLSEMGRSRVAAGFNSYKELKNKGYRILLTGGYGEHFNATTQPNAYYASLLLLENGVPPDHIVEFAESRNTVDDALQVRPIVEKYNCRNLIVVSSDFHIKRVNFIFREVFPEYKIEFIGAPYLNTVTDEEQKKLLDHEDRGLKNLINHRRSIAGGTLSLDSWKKNA